MSNIQAGRPVLRGVNERRAGLQTRVLVRELHTLPPLPSGAIFKPLDLSDPKLSKFSVIESAIVSVLAVIALACAFAILFFVET